MGSELTPAASPEPDAAARAASRVVPGRECGTCTLCCKVMGIEELSKPPGVWCPHCVRGVGCGIYETRPAECRVFFCHWMLEKNLPAEWKPERAKFALVTSLGGHITAFVDQGFPSAWRNAPYYEVLKRWALEGTRAKPARFVLIRIGTRGIVILPDREIDIGTVGPNMQIELESDARGRVNVRKVTRPG